LCPHRADVIAAGYVFDTDMADCCYATVSDQLAPAGYSYLLIEQGRGTVASCMFKGFHDERQYLDATLAFAPGGIECRERVQSLVVREAGRLGQVDCSQARGGRS
jgi:hypothetical protein